MRGGGGGSKEREKAEALHTSGACNGSVARKMLQGGRRCGAKLCEHTKNPVSRCILYSLENTRIRSGLRPVQSGRSYVFLNTEGESGG